MKFLAIPLICLFLCIYTSCDAPEQLRPEVDDELETLLAEEDFASLTVGIIKDGKQTMYFKGSLVNGAAPNKETLFEIASLTKTFTGTLLARAAYDGKIGIDDDIRLYLSDSFPNLAYEEHPITFRHVLTHTSGLPRMFPDIPDLFKDFDWDKLPNRINAVQQGFDRSDFMLALEEVKLDTVPGSKFSYSNAGANLMGYCLEDIYQESYHSLMHQYILDPMAMQHTYLKVPEESLQHLAVGLNPNGVEMPFGADKYMKAEGGIYSNVVDMLGYMEYHLDPYNAIARIAHEELLEGKYGAFDNGYFWQLYKEEGQAKRVYQNGGAYGTSSWITLIPEQGLGIFMVSNVSGPEIHRKMSECVDRLILILNDE